MRKVLFSFLSVYRGDVRVPGLEEVFGLKAMVVTSLVRHQRRFLDFGVQWSFTCATLSSGSCKILEPEIKKLSTLQPKTEFRH
jgi:hypothetical protein